YATLAPPRTAAEAPPGLRLYIPLPPGPWPLPNAPHASRQEGYRDESRRQRADTPHRPVTGALGGCLLPYCYSPLVYAHPPAMAGIMASSSPSFRTVFSPSIKRISSSLR